MAENRADQFDGVGFVEMFFERVLVWTLPIIKIKIVAAKRLGLRVRGGECRGHLLGRFIISTLIPIAKDRFRDVFGGIENAINGNQLSLARLARRDLFKQSLPCPRGPSADA